jgi:hypothetical protein
MTAQDEPSTRHSSGTSGVAQTITPPRITTEASKENQNLVYVGRHVRKQGAKYLICRAPFHDFGNFFKKVGKLDFFLGCTPCHVIREQVRKNSLAHGNAQPTKEEKAETENQLNSSYAKGQDSSQERSPASVCHERRHLEVRVLTRG